MADEEELKTADLVEPPASVAAESPPDPFASLDDEALSSHPRVQAHAERIREQAKAEAARESQARQERWEREQAARAEQFHAEGRDYGMAEAQQQGVYYGLKQLHKSDPEAFATQMENPQAAAIWSRGQQAERTSPDIVARAQVEGRNEGGIRVLAEWTRDLPDTDRKAVEGRYNQGGYQNWGEIRGDIQARYQAHWEKGMTKKQAEEDVAKKEAWKREILAEIRKGEGYEELEGKFRGGSLTPERYAKLLAEGKTPTSAEIDAMTTRYLG